MRNAIGLTIALLLALAAALPAESTEPADILFSDSILVVGEPVHLLPVPPGKAFEIAFRVGELEIEARPVLEARLEVQATCREVSAQYCRQRVERLSLKSRELEDRVRVELTGMSRREMKKLGIEATIVVPEHAPLIVKMGIGDLEIYAGPESLDIGMSIGDLTVHAPADAIGSVGIATRIGDASLGTPDVAHVQSKHRLLLGARLQWEDGRGDSHIAVRLGIGDAQVRLD